VKSTVDFDAKIDDAPSTGTAWSNEAICFRGLSEDIPRSLKKRVLVIFLISQTAVTLCECWPTHTSRFASQSPSRTRADLVYRQ